MESEKENSLAIQQPSFMGIIEKAVSDPNFDADKLDKLISANERILAKQAEIDFTQARTRLADKLPFIEKNGMIVFTDKNNNERRTPHARYEDIQEAIQPHLIEEGFALSFDTEHVANSPLIIKATLLHRSGHKVTISVPLPRDTSGSKNDLQALGSTIQYAKRYLVGMLLDIKIKGKDDDGSSFPITTEQAVELDLLIKSTGADKEKLLKKLGVDDVRKVMTKDYLSVLNGLKARAFDKAKKDKENVG